MKKIAIIGAGLSGLLTAWFVKKVNKEIEITIFEGQKKGGKIIGEKLEGLYLERGAAGIFSINPLLDYIVEELKLKDQLIKAHEYRLNTVKQEYMQKPPGDFFKCDNYLFSFITGGWQNLFGQGKKVSVWSGLSLHDFFKSSFGETYTELYGSVYSRFVFGCEPSDVDVKSVFPELSDSINRQGSLKKGVDDFTSHERSFWKSSIIQKENYNAGFFNFKGGLFALIEALEHDLKQMDVKFEYAKIQTITRDRETYTLHSKSSRYSLFNDIIITPQAYDQASLWKELDKSVTVDLNNFRYFASNTVYFVWNNDMTKKLGTGFIAPQKEKFTMYGLLNFSSVFSDLTEGKSVLKITVPGDISLLGDDDILQLLMQDIKKSYGITVRPDAYTIYRDPKAYPVMDSKYSDYRKELLSKVAHFPGIHLHGADFTGPLPADIMRRSFMLAQKYSSIQSEQAAS